MTVSQRTRHSPIPRDQVGITWGCIMIGTKTSTDSPTSTPWNPGGPIPTTVMGWPFTRTAWPTTLGSPPKRRAQKPWLRTTTGWPPGTRSSSGVSSRPAAGFTPSTWKKVPDTRAPFTASVWLPTVR